MPTLYIKIKYWRSTICHTKVSIIKNQGNDGSFQANVFVYFNHFTHLLEVISLVSVSCELRTPWSPCTLCTLWTPPVYTLLKFRGFSGESVETILSSLSLNLLVRRRGLGRLLLLSRSTDSWSCRPLSLKEKAIKNWSPSEENIFSSIYANILNCLNWCTVLSKIKLKIKTYIWAMGVSYSILYGPVPVGFFFWRSYLLQ